MAGMGFRWLDILEKEFDKAFVDLDLAIGELDSDEPDIVCNVRQKMSTLSSCFAQLTHKAQTIFQNSAKIEAELIHMRAELIDSKSRREILEQELHTLLLQLHSAQLAYLPGAAGGRHPDSKIEPDVHIIRKKLQDELKKSPNHRLLAKDEELKFSANTMENTHLRAENMQLLTENTSLRSTVLALNSEVYGAKLAAKYLDKELAGRIQQLQLLGREMRGETRDKLWRQLESEILLQRHKTVVRACRRNSQYGNARNGCPKPDITLNNGQDIGEVRDVLVKRSPGQGLGISITGGREHGVPILISELEANGPAALCGNLYIGDAILSVNNVDLRQVCHREAVDILQKQSGDCRLEVQYIAADDSDNSLSEDGYNFHYRFFDGDVCDLHDDSRNPYGVLNTPTAPRTPESQNNSRSPSEYNNSLRESPSKQAANVTQPNKSFLDETKSVQNTTETLTITENLIDITNIANNLLTQNPLNDNIPTDMIDLNSNRSSETEENRLFERIEESEKLNNNFNRIANEKLNNFNCSSNSLVSENLSSPMQTSTDNIVDSEIASNDSQSPKCIESNEESLYGHSLLEMKTFNEFCSSYEATPKLYSSNETFSNPKSDQSLLNSESCDSSPVHKGSKDYLQRKQPKKKKMFGVKTLQAIFNKNDGYSDISSTNSDFGDDNCLFGDSSLTISTSLPKPILPEVSPHFDRNIHAFLSDTFEKKQLNPEVSLPNLTVSNIGNKKYFLFNGQHVRVGKALRLCPNEEVVEKSLVCEHRPNSEQKLVQREKLLARYVYNSNAVNVDGIGDPDFGTPV